MRVEETAFTKTSFKGVLQDDKLDGKMHYTLEPHAGRIFLTLNSQGHYTHIFMRDLPRLVNFYRDLGECLDLLQPGLIFPLPEGDPSEVDAMKVIYEADRLRKEGK